MEIELLNTNINFSGLIVGAYTFLIIMLARWLCIWGEFHFTKRFWILFLIIGIISSVGSILFANYIFSAILAVTGFTFLWGINETIEQEERVEKGWYPKKSKK